ncbi:hypothetical protein B9Z55_007404 [Caenorhabditis nigoni]|nr:hypothetical protein B9Z55_007404 [Caenorhabditis nigoni]
MTQKVPAGFSQAIEHSGSLGSRQGSNKFSHSPSSQFQRLDPSLAQFIPFGINVPSIFSSSSFSPSTVPLSSAHGLPLLPPPFPISPPVHQAPHSELEPISELAQKRRAAQAHCADSSLYKEPGLACILNRYTFNPSKTEYPQKVHSAPKYPKKLYVAWFRKNLKGKVSDADRQWQEWGEMETKVELAEWKLCLERIRREQSEQLKLGMIEI